VSFLPCRGSGSDSSTGDVEDDEFVSEHRRLQRTPTPYYEEPPTALQASETLNVDDMEATEGMEDSVTDMSGMTLGQALRILILCGTPNSTTSHRWQRH